MTGVLAKDAMLQDTPSQPPPIAPLAERLDRRVAPGMFLFSLGYLLVLAGFIHRVGHGHETLFEANVIGWTLLLVWPVFFVDGGLRFIAASGRQPRQTRLLLWLVEFLLPFARLGYRGYADSTRIWLPWFGWRTVDKSLRKDLERFFSVPMIVIALLVLPVLALEMFWKQLVDDHFALALSLDIASSVIWMAFAIEFTLLFSVADKKVRFCIQNWTDLAVVALPLVDFLPALRLWQLGRVLALQQLSRMGRMYRLRGLMMKAWRAILLLDMIQRLFGNYKEKRLKRLKELLAARLEEVEELRAEIADLEKDQVGQAIVSLPEARYSHEHANQPDPDR